MWNCPSTTRTWAEWIEQIKCAQPTHHPARAENGGNTFSGFCSTQHWWMQWFALVNHLTTSPRPGVERYWSAPNLSSGRTLLGNSFRTTEEPGKGVPSQTWSSVRSRDADVNPCMDANSARCLCVLYASRTSTRNKFRGANHSDVIEHCKVGTMWMMHVSINDHEQSMQSLYYMFYIHVYYCVYWQDAYEH